MARLGIKYMSAQGATIKSNLTGVEIHMGKFQGSPGVFRKAPRQPFKGQGPLNGPWRAPGDP